MIHNIKALHDDGQGLSIRSIGQKLGISRNTVRKYLRQDVAAIEAARRTGSARRSSMPTTTTSPTCCLPSPG